MADVISSCLCGICELCNEGNEVRWTSATWKPSLRLKLQGSALLLSLGLPGLCDRVDKTTRLFIPFPSRSPNSLRQLRHTARQHHARCVQHGRLFCLLVVSLRARRQCHDRELQIALRQIHVLLHAQFNCSLAEHILRLLELATIDRIPAALELRKSQYKLRISIPCRSSGVPRKDVRPFPW